MSRSGLRLRWQSHLFRMDENIWFHFAVTWREEGALKVYINGEVKSAFEGKTYNAGRPNKGSRIYIGLHSSTHSANPNVTMDELYLWIDEEKDESDIRKYSDLSHAKGESLNSSVLHQCTTVN